jgi:metal-sulfur cluster biosynthetic enzyme
MNEASERIETAERADAGPGSAAPAIDDREPAEKGNGNGAVGADEVREALKAVLDPELGINIVDLGLVYDVDIADGHVHVTYSLTTMGCPIGPMIEAQMHQLLDPLPGVDSFDAELVLRPPWSPEMMSEEAKEALGYF